MSKDAKKLTKDGFASPQDVRWCPGCGDYSVLAAVQRLLPSFERPPEKYVFVSGIGCSSRFPYYMNTYGFHTIHGRAPAVATGVKLSNPELSVWLITGDGDALSIGGNHLLHILRRNLDVNILLFNNRIYGLTKGQYSPTSEQGKITKSTPYGSTDFPVNPLLFALGSQATFVARTLDVDAKHMTTVLEAAEHHRGTSFVEIYQNCNIFNDGAWSSVADRKTRPDTQLLVEHDKPLIFGTDLNKGIRIENNKPSVVTFEAGSEKAALEAGVTIYDEGDPILATILAGLSMPEFPSPMGVLHRTLRPTFNEVVLEQLAKEKEKKPSKSVDESLASLFQTGDTWTVS